MSEENGCLPESGGLSPELLAEVYRALNFDPD